MNEPQQLATKNNKRLLKAGIVFAILMFGFGFALVPLYDVFCNVFGINGKTNGSPLAAYNTGKIDKNRTIRVEFLAARNDNLPWEFHPQKKSIEIHPGEKRTIYYYAANETDHTMTVQAVPSVAPGSAAQYLKKTECFCFEQQKLAAGKSIDMPLIFHIEPDLPKSIHTISLSYTLFNADTAGGKRKAVVGKIR